MTAWHDAGLSLERIGDYIGHSHAYMTNHYRHLLDEHRDADRARLDAYYARNGAELSSGTIEQALEASA